MTRSSTISALLVLAISSFPAQSNMFSRPSPETEKNEPEVSSSQSGSLCSNIDSTIGLANTSLYLRCASNAMAGLAIIHNLVRTSKDWNHEEKKAKPSIGSTLHSHACFNANAKAITDALSKTSDNVKKVDMNNGPKDFLLSIVDIQKERLSDKTLKADFAPKLVGLVYKKKIVKDNDSPLLKDLTSPLEVFTKYSLNSNISSEEERKDGEKAFLKFTCGEMTTNAINGLTKDKIDWLNVFMKTSKEMNGVKGKVDEAVLYFDLVSLLALKGGELGKNLLDKTITPGFENGKKWTLSQKAKAAQFGLKMKNFILKNKDSAISLAKNTQSDISDGAGNLANKGSGLVALSQRELQNKINLANIEMDNLNEKVNDLVRDGMDIQAPNKIKNIAIGMQLKWAQIRNNRDRQIEILKKKTLALLCKTPNSLLNDEQLSEKETNCELEEEKKKGFFQRAKDKIKSVFKRKSENAP